MVRGVGSGWSLIYVKLLRDVVLLSTLQDEMIANLRGADSLELAALINEIVDR
jgi:hypothetical protein